MYLEHYGLRELPFSLTPDTSFFFGYGHYRDAYNTLMVALQNGEGFIKVTGEVGTGKTLLCRKLLNSLGEAEGDQFATAYIPNPYLTPSARILAVADELGIDIDAREGTHRTLKQITRRLIELGNEEKRVVLCIDEAQAMPEQTLETLRLITNLETEKRKLLHVVLFGQPELDQRLEQQSARQLRQRITFSYTLQPLDAEGIAAYLQHRLLVAGGHGEVSFDSAAVKQLYRGSGGFPRLINILAHKALMLGYGQGIKQIGAEQVKAAISDTEGAHRVTVQQSPGRRLSAQTLGIVLSLALLALVASYYLPPLLSPEAGAVTRTEASPDLVEPDGENIPVAVVEEVAPSAMLEAPPPATVETPVTPPVAAVAPQLTGVTPARISGSWESQTLLLHGEALPQDAQLIVSWSGREKLLPPQRVEWLDPNTLRITLTSGLRSEAWQVQLVGANGVRGDAVSFEVVGPN